MPASVNQAIILMCVINLFYIKEYYYKRTLIVDFYL